MKPSILLVTGTEETKTKNMQSFLEEKGYSLSNSSGPQEGYSIVIWYLDRNDVEKFELMKRFKSRNPNTRLILIADLWEKKSLLEAIRAGAKDCLEYPADLHTLGQVIGQVVSEFQQDQHITPTDLRSNHTMGHSERAEGNGNGNGSHLRLVGASGTETSDLDQSYTKIKRKWLAQFEKEYLISTLIKYRGNVSAAARNARLDRSNFLRLLRKYGLQAQEFRKAA